jgi:hypothetical protein
MKTIQTWWCTTFVLVTQQVEVGGLQMKAIPDEVSVNIFYDYSVIKPVKNNKKNLWKVWK